MPGTSLDSEKDRYTPCSYRTFSLVGKMSINKKSPRSAVGEEVLAGRATAAPELGTKKCFVGGS